MEHNAFRKSFLAIAVPISLNQVINSLVNFLDTLMIGGLGEIPIASVGLANKLFFIFSISLFGIYSGAGIFSAQYWGVRDLKSLHRVLGIMLILGVTYSFVFIGIGMVFPEAYLRIFSQDPEVIRAGAIYLRWVAPSYLLTAISYMYAYTSRIIERSKYPMYLSIVSLCTNALLNYALIYGKFGLPELGVQGAAIATLIARLVELILYIWLIQFYLADHPLRTKFSELMSFNLELVKKVTSKSIPVFFNETLWVVGQTVYFIAYGLLGSSALTSVQIASTAGDLLGSMFIGICSAAHVMIGGALGRHDFEEAKTLAARFHKIMFVIALVVGIFISLSSLGLPLIYPDFSAETLKMTMFTMISIGIFQIPKNYNYLAVIGVLRSGGDAIFCLATDILSVWLVGIPLAFLAAAVLHLPIYLVVAFSFMEEAFKMIPLSLRVKSGKWLNNLIHEPSAGNENMTD